MMRISIISFLFGLFLFTTSNANDINYVHEADSSFDISTTPWVLKDLHVGQTIDLEGLQFEDDEFELNESSKNSLSSLVDFLIANPTVRIEIGGHTNSMPPHEYCDQLSNKRAQSVREYLVSKGINPKNIEAKGHGKRSPKSSSYSSTGRKSNQRVDVRIVEL